MKAARKMNDRVRYFLYIVIGISISIISCVVYLLLGQSPANEFTGPLILLASTVQNSEVSILERVSDDGTVVLDLNAPSDTVVWLRILEEEKHKFKWNCSGDVEAVVLSGSEHENISNVLGNSGGYDNSMVFRVVGNNHAYSARIVFKSDYPMQESINTCKVRLPWIIPWYSDIGYSIMASDEKLETSDERLMDRKIDGNMLYLPLYNYYVTIPNLSKINRNKYETRLIVPTANDMRGYYFWKGALDFAPSLIYDKKRYAYNDFCCNFMCMIIGVGLSLILGGIKHLLK